MDEINKFLSNFKSLEKKLIDISGLENEYTSFSRALSKVHFDKLNELVSDDQIYDFLRSASDLRNILSHQNDICVPSTEFNAKFEEIVNEIINPLECIDIATKGNDIMYVELSSNVINVVNEMEKRHYSHVPVIKGGKVIGVFSRSIFFEYIYFNKKLVVNNEYIVEDFIRQTDLQKHLNESFVFVSRKIKAYALLKYFSKKKAGERRVSVVFITENGRPEERLLGVLTETDLLKLPLYERQINSLGKIVK